MRKKIKESLLEIIKSMYEAHNEIRKFVKKQSLNNASKLLGDCQDVVISIGEMIQSSEGEDFVTIGIIEKYCHDLFDVYNSLNKDVDWDGVYKLLNKDLTDIKKSIERDIIGKIEVVFLPYKASMWDSLESVWKAADEDPQCDAYVVPIPYYDRNPDHSFGEFHYEGDLFTDDIMITNYKFFNLKLRHPDIIFVQNCYDDRNFVTSVHPDFYTSVLKKCTNYLAYLEYGIPLWIYNKETPYDVINRGWFNIDLFFTYSKQYADNQKYAMKLISPEITTEFIPLGSPKFDKVLNSKKSDFEIPEHWNELIKNRKVILLNTSLGEMLKDTENYLIKLEKIINEFKNNDNVILWWRPHPLSIATFSSMRSIYQKKYDDIIKKYQEEGWGIYDDSPDVHRAIAYADAYYGDESSLVYMFCATGKPFTLSGTQHQLKYFTDDTDSFEKSLQWRMYNMANFKGANAYGYNVCMWWHNFSENIEYVKYLRLFLDFVIFPEKYPDAERYRQLQLKVFRDFVENPDGTAGLNIYLYCKNKILKGNNYENK